MRGGRLPAGARCEAAGRCAPRRRAQDVRLHRRITGEHFSKNLSIEKVREIARSDDPDSLHAFAEACRAELRAMRWHL